MFGKRSGKRYLVGIVSSVLLSTMMLSACSTEKASNNSKKNLDNLNKTGMPIVKKKIELDGFAAKFFASQDWNKLMLWQKYEEMTNIHINWKTVSTEVLTEKRNLMMASGEYPDIMFASALPKSDLMKYGKQGVLIPLNDLIDKYAPNFKKIMDEYPAVKAGVTMADGKIYGFPFIADPQFKGLRYGTPWINKNWLVKLGLKEPTTLNEFYEVLKKFKEEDPNGNGKADEIPWGNAYSIDQAINFLKGSFGLNNHGMANPHVDLDNSSRKLRFVPTTDGYKKLLEYLNKLYKDGLLDKEVFSSKTEEFNARAGEGNMGVISSIDPKVLLNLDGYVGTPVLAGPDGTRKSTDIGSPLGNVGMFVITSKNENPAATVRWMDYFYGDDGAKMFFMGFEGVTYKKNEKGELEYTDEITHNPDGLNLDQAISKYLTWPGGYYPGIVKKDYFQGAEASAASEANAEKAIPYTIEQSEIWPSFNFTNDEQDELTPIATDINTYVQEMTAKFITGKVSFSKWDSYVKTLDKMNVKRYLEIYEAAYKRYKDSK